MKVYRDIKEEFHNYYRSKVDRDNIVPVFKNPTEKEWDEIANPPQQGFAKAIVDDNNDIYAWGDFTLFHNDDIPDGVALYRAFAEWDGTEFDLYIHGWDELFPTFDDWLEFQDQMYKKHDLLGSFLEDGTVFDSMDNQMLRANQLR